MHIVFVDNLLIRSKPRGYQLDLQPHLGLLSLIGVVRSAGYTATLFDPKLAVEMRGRRLDQTLYRRLAEDILDHDPQVVGLTSLGCNFICTVKVASYIKTLAPHIPVLLGGPHASILAGEILGRFPEFDIVVRNEAERTIVPLLEHLDGGRPEHIAGITYRLGSEIIANPGAPLLDDLDELPWPAFDSYPIKELNLKAIRVEAGRGCPFHCTFCSTASFFGRSYRLKSPSRLCAELDYLNKHYNVSHFALMHDLFTVNRTKVRAFCEEVASRGFTWSCSARMDCVDADLLREMYDSGCRQIYYGVESGSSRMQRLTRKHQDLSLFNPILQATSAVGMSATVSFITGYPEEEQQDQDDTLDMLGSCFRWPAESVKVQLHLLAPEPGTRLFEEFGHLIRYDGHTSDFTFPTLEEDDGPIMADNPQIFMNHYFFESPISRGRNIFATSVFETLHQFGYPFLAHLLEYYEKKLSLLVRRLFDWNENHARVGRVDADLVRQFVRSEWGQHHHLTSVADYLATAIQLSERPDDACPMRTSSQPPGESGVDGADRLVLSTRAAILPHTHDCPAILERLASGDARIDGVLGERFTYLIFVEDGGARFVRNFVVTSPVTDLLEEIRSPRTCDELGRLFGDLLADGGDLQLAIQSLERRAIIHRLK